MTSLCATFNQVRLMLSPTIVRNIRYLEWLFLIIHIILYLSKLSDQRLLSLSTPIYVLYTLIYAIFFGLSFYFPEHHPYCRRRVYIYSSLVLAIAANSINVPTNFLVYLYVGKSCFLLSRKETLLIVIFAGFSWTLSELYSVYSAVEKSGDIIFDPLYGQFSVSFLRVLSSSLGIYLGASLFIVLFCFTIIAEQKSRRKAEILSQQVEALTKNLERTRIARDIHDSLGHTLTNLNVQLQLAQRLRQKDLDQAFQAIDLAQMLSSQCIEDVSYALASIRQFDFDLNQAIEHLIDQLRRNSNIKAKVALSISPLPPQISHQVYFIIKECLINVQKHAQASQVYLRGKSTPSSIWLEIGDNGVGFVPHQTPTGFGLKGISERVQMLGGELKIDSILGQGAHIQVKIPL